MEYFEIESTVPDYEHEGDASSWACELEMLVEEDGGIKVSSSYYIDYDCEYAYGSQGIVVIRGKKEDEVKVKEIIEGY